MPLSAYECNFDAITWINLAVKPSRYDMSYFQKKYLTKPEALHVLYVWELTFLHLKHPFSYNCLS